MKIAYIITSLAQEGPANVVMDLVKVMMAHGHYCKVYYFDTKPNEHTFPCDTQKITFSESIPFKDFDLVHTHSLRPDIYAFLRKPFFIRTKLICTIHNFVFQDLISDHGKFKGIIGGIIWQLSRYRNDRIIVLNKSAKRYYSRWFCNKKLRIAYNTRVLDKSISIPLSDKDIIDNLHQQFNVVCCSICRVTDRKGLNQIVEALPQLPKNICYLIIGDGQGVTKLKELVEKLSLTNRVYFIGNRIDGYRYLPYIDIFCIPSHSEGFPLAMLEAASYGKAIISSDIKVFKEIFTEEEIMICQENDIDSFVSGFLKLIPQIELFGAKAKARFESDYSPEAFYKNHINIYNEVLK